MDQPGARRRGAQGGRIIGAQIPRVRPYRVVLTNTGTLGDFLPLVAIAVELRARGMAVVLAGMEDYRFAAEAEELPFLPIRPGQRELAADGLDHKAMAQAVMRDLRAAFAFTLPYLDQTVADLRTAMRGADLVVSGPLAVVARLVAEAQRIPTATVLLQPMGFLSAAEPPAMREMPLLPWIGRHLGPRFVRPLYALGSKYTCRLLKPLAALRREWQLPPVRDEVRDGMLRTQAIFAFYPEAFAPLPSDAPGHAISAGFPFYDGAGRPDSPLDPALQAFLDRGAPPLVFTLGSFVTHAPTNFYAVSAAAATALGRRAVLLVGEHAEQRFAHLASDDVFVAGFVQHSSLFRRAVAVVHHGGIGTITQALAVGIPQLVCPYFGDQLDNGLRLERLGVGRVLTLRRFGFVTACDALRELLDDRGFQERAERLAPAVSTRRGASTVADWIERHLSADRRAIPR